MSDTGKLLTRHRMSGNESIRQTVLAQRRNLRLATADIRHQLVTPVHSERKLRQNLQALREMTGQNNQVIIFKPLRQTGGGGMNHAMLQCKRQCVRIGINAAYSPVREVFPGGHGPLTANQAQTDDGKIFERQQRQCNALPLTRIPL